MRELGDNVWYKRVANVNRLLLLRELLGWWGSPSHVKVMAPLDYISSGIADAHPSSDVIGHSLRWMLSDLTMYGNVNLIQTNVSDSSS